MPKLHNYVLQWARLLIQSQLIALQETITEICEVLKVMKVQWTTDPNLSLFTRCVCLYALVCNVGVFVIICGILPFIGKQVLEVRYWVMLNLSVIPVIFKVLTEKRKHTQIQHSFLDICRLCGMSMKQFWFTRKSAMKAVKSPFCFFVYVLSTVHLCCFWLLSIPYYAFFHNKISDRLWAQLAIAMWYLYEKRYPFIGGFYLLTLAYFFGVWIICQRYPSYPQFFYTTFSHTFVAHLVGNSPGKKSSETLALLAGLGVLATLTALGGYLNEQSRIEYAERVVYRAIEDSKKPGSPSAEVIIAMQISVRRFGTIDAILNRGLDSFRVYTRGAVDIAKQQADVAQTTAQLESFRAQTALEIARNELEKLKLKEKQLLDMSHLTAESSSGNEVVDEEEELPPIQIPSPLRQFPFTKSDFIPAVWDVLNQVYGNYAVETVQALLDDLSSQRDEEDLGVKDLISKDDTK